MEPPAQAWQTLHICSTTSLSYCGERGISPRADTSPPWASASCLHTSTYGLSFKNGNAAGKPDSPFYHFSAGFFSLSLFSEVITASKTNGGEHAICSPTNLPLHPGGLGRVLSWKFMRCSRGWKQRFYINTETKQGNGTCFALIMSGSPLKDSTLNLSVMWPLVSFFKNDIHWVRPLHWTSGKVRKMLT